VIVGSTSSASFTFLMWFTLGMRAFDGDEQRLGHRVLLGTGDLAAPAFVAGAASECWGSSESQRSVRAVDEPRVLVTENSADFAVLVDHRSAAEEPVATVVFLRKSSFPNEGLAHHIAVHLHAWAEATPEPFTGIHWP